MTDPYAPRDAAQDARFVAFIQGCEELIQSAAGHQHVMDFVRGLDLDGRRALYKYAVKADAQGLIVLIGRAHAGEQLREPIEEKLARFRKDGVYGSGD